MANCGCHSCREYGECDGERHTDRINARHYGDGKYWWGKNPPKGGRLVKLCEDCIEAMSEEPVSREEFESSP